MSGRSNTTLGEVLSPQALIDLGWMRRVNDEAAIGLYSTSVAKLGRVEAAEECVASGLASFDWRRGYWITAAGRDVLRGRRGGMGSATSPHSAPVDPGYGMQLSPCPRRGEEGA